MDGSDKIPFLNTYKSSPSTTPSKVALSQATPYKTYRFEANDLYQLEYQLIHLGISQYYDQTSSR